MPLLVLSVLQVEQYNEEMRNEIAITRRATYKVEENLQDLGEYYALSSQHDVISRRVIGVLWLTYGMIREKEERPRFVY